MTDDKPTQEKPGPRRKVETALEDSRSGPARELHQKLRTNEAGFRVILDNGPTIAWIKDGEGRYTYLSRNFEKYFGIRAKDWIGKTCEDLYPPEIAAMFRKNDLRVLEKGHPMDFMEEADTPDGARRICQVRKIPLRDAEGRWSVGGFGIDITERKHAEEALRDSERRLREAQRIAKIASYERNFDTQEGYWSDEHYRLFGYEPGEVTPSFDLFLNHIHEDDRKRVEKKLRRVYRKLESFDHDFRYIRHDGETRHARHTGKGVLSEDGKSRWLRGTFQDITERKRVEASLASAHAEAVNESNRLRAIMDALPVGVSILDARGGQILWNRAFDQIWGAPRPKAASIEEYFPYKAWWLKTGRRVQPEEWASAISVEKGETVIGQLMRIERFDGSRVVIQNSAVPIFDPQGGIIECAVAVMDITDLKQTEEELHIAKNAAEAASRAKSDFIANMSHELRTPLNAILGYCQVLTRDPSLSDTNRGNLLTIQKSGEHLLTLINDILDIARIEAEKMSLDPSPADLKGVLRDTVEFFRPKANQKGIALAANIDPTLPDWVSCDAKRLRQVLLNLLSNAVKFTDNGEVALHVFPAGEKIAFSVKDTGSGIAEDMLSSIFDPFQQAGPANGKSEGAGLGLFISKKLVQLMGGEIRVKSAVEKGSEFRFEMELTPVLFEINCKKSLPEKVFFGYDGKKRKAIAEDIVEEHGDDSIDLTSLVPPSDDALETLRAMSGIGDIVGIRKYAEKLRKDHPETEVFCNLLMNYAGKIDIEKIAELLKN